MDTPDLPERPPATHRLPDGREVWDEEAVMRWVGQVQNKLDESWRVQVFRMIEDYVPLSSRTSALERLGLTIGRHWNAVRGR